jgi:lipoprotein NlpD
MNNSLFYKVFKIIVLFSIALFLTACMMQSYDTHQQNLFNSSSSANNYIVQRGDSLSSIASRYGLNFQEIAVLNNISSPYRIYVGQNLRIPMRNMPISSTPNPVNQTPTHTRMRRLNPRFSKQSFSQPSIISPNSDGNCYPPISWQWPTYGVVEQTTSSTGTQGINIFGYFRQSIQAAASGMVIYSGKGVNGYKNLIIIQHDNAFITTYSHNHRRRVIEGQQVSAGETIAEMGQNIQRRPMLHFEIRCRENAIDPLFYLPK